MVLVLYHCSVFVVWFTGDMLLHLNGQEVTWSNLDTVLQNVKKEVTLLYFFFFLGSEIIYIIPTFTVLFF